MYCCYPTEPGIQYINDTTLNNLHWSSCTGIFSSGDIGRVEREFLDVLDWELSVQEPDIIAHHDMICSIPPSPPRFEYHNHHRNSHINGATQSATKPRHQSHIKEVSRWTDGDDSPSSSSSYSSSSSLLSSSSSLSSTTPYSLLNRPTSPIRREGLTADWVHAELDVLPPPPITYMFLPSYRRPVSGTFRDVLRFIPSRMSWATASDRSQTMVPPSGPMRI